MQLRSVFFVAFLTLFPAFSAHAAAPSVSGASPSGAPCSELVDLTLRQFDLGNLRAPAAVRSHDGPDVEFMRGETPDERQRIVGFANPRVDYPFVAARYEALHSGLSFRVELVADRDCRLRSLQGEIRGRTEADGEIHRARFGVVGESCRAILSDARYARLGPDEWFTPRNVAESREALELNSRFGFFDTIDETWPMGRLAWLCRRFESAFASDAAGTDASASDPTGR